MTDFIFIFEKPSVQFKKSSTHTGCRCCRKRAEASADPKLSTNLKALRADYNKEVREIIEEYDKKINGVRAAYNQKIISILENSCA